VAIEPIEFNVFGIRISVGHVMKIKSAMENTYHLLMKEVSPKWEDRGFCKREIASLWDGIVDMFTRFYEEKFDISSDKIKDVLLVDQDNQKFLDIFGYELKRNGAVDDILNQLKEIGMGGGSLRIHFKDLLSRERLEARIKLDKITKRIGKESNKIKTALMQFVDWVMRNERAILTCSLVAGVVTISLVASIWIGLPLEVGKLLLLSAIAILCLIYEAVGAFSTLRDAKRAIFRRLGLSFMPSSH